MNDPNDSIQSLALIAAAAARLMAHMHRSGLTDPYEEIGLMRAALDHVAQQLAARKGGAS